MIARAIVTLTDQQGNVRSTITNNFGYFSFEDVMAGQSYVISVNAKRYAGSSQVIIVMDELKDLNFILTQSPNSAKGEDDQ